MLNYRNPWWLIVITIIPVATLFWIFYGTFDVIESLLSEENIRVWTMFGITLGLFWVSHVGYCIWCITRKKLLDKWYAFGVLLSYSPFLYLYLTYYDDLIPWSIPQWMVSGNLILYAGSFLMPTLIHGLFILVLYFTNRKPNQKTLPNFIIAISIPVVWYLLFQLVFPLWRHVHAIETHLMVVMTMSLTTIFLFFVMRGFYVLSIKKEEFIKNYGLVIKVIIAIAFPVAGLVVNNDMFFRFIFGNFSDPWFYILAITNGLVVCLPDRDHKYYRLVIFCVRSITFTYIIYFFFVFLPFLPLSVIAIVAVGLGFLMLTPLILMVFQTRMLVDDFIYLYRNYSKRTVNALFSVSVLTIPIVVSAVYVKDKNILQRALHYVYEPDYNEVNKYTVDPESLKNVLSHVKLNKDRNGDEEIPFLSSYYNWIVLDNLTLSNEKINYLERVFNGKKAEESNNFSLQFISNQRNNINITKTTSASTYNQEKKFWTSVVDFEITNHETGQREFTTSFNLPDGAWINDYYLWINDEKVPGILAEKKAATWIYQQVTSYRQDPGILHYTTGNTISFRVFPFAANEKRTTGLQIIHKESFQLNIDGQSIPLGNETPETSESYHEEGNTTYISKQFKSKLNPVERAPYYHFIIDCSQHSKGKEIAFANSIKTFLKNNGKQNKPSFTLTNVYSTTYNDAGDLPSLLESQDYSGGFLLEHAIKKILYKNYVQPTNKYPVIVVVTDSMEDALVARDFKDFKLTFPESDLFYSLNSSGELVVHSFVDDPIKPCETNASSFRVGAWPNSLNPQAYIRLDDQPSILVSNRAESNQPAQSNLQKDDWQSALSLHGQWINHTLHPENTERDWLQLVKNSFATHIMTPVTSFIALENEAQRKTLLNKQKQTMNAEKALDLGDEDRMSEPGFMLCIGIVMIILLVTHRKSVLLCLVKSH